MNLMLTIKNLEQKKKVEALIEEKLQKLAKHISANIKVSWKYFRENGLHFSEVQVSGFHGPVVRARAKSQNKYKVVDLAVSKLESQLRRRQDILKPKSTQGYDYLLEQDNEPNKGMYD